MECRPLEIKVLSAKDLKDVNFMTKMDVYAEASIKGDPSSKQKQKQKHKTPVHKDCGPNPKWNYSMKFTLDETSAQKNGLIIKFKLKAEKTFGGDREVGEVHVPIKELLDAKEGHGQHKEVSYPVRTASGKNKGALTFSYQFGEKFTAPVQEKAKKMEEPVAAYPAPGYPGSAAGYAGSSAVPYPAQGAYPTQPPAYQYPYAPPGGYPAPPPQHAYGNGYPPQPGYGYPGYPPQPGYGGYPPAVQKPKKGGGNMALGLGAGLLGGLLVGDMIGDIGEAAAYDSGYDAGFDDGFGF